MCTLQINQSKSEFGIRFYPDRNTLGATQFHLLLFKSRPLLWPFSDTNDEVHEFDDAVLVERCVCNPSCVPVRFIDVMMLC